MQCGGCSVAFETNSISPAFDEHDSSGRQAVLPFPPKCIESSNSSGAFFFPIDSIVLRLRWDEHHENQERDDSDFGREGEEFAHHKLRARPDTDIAIPAKKSRSPRRPPPASYQIPSFLPLPLGSPLAMQWRRRHKVYEKGRYRLRETVSVLTRVRAARSRSLE